MYLLTFFRKIFTHAQTVDTRCSFLMFEHLGTRLMRTQLRPPMHVQNMEASIFQELPVGMSTHTQAFQYDMATFLELWLAACLGDGEKALTAFLVTSTINMSEDTV